MQIMGRVTFKYRNNSNCVLATNFLMFQIYNEVDILVNGGTCLNLGVKFII